MVTFVAVACSGAHGTQSTTADGGIGPSFGVGGIGASGPVAVASEAGACAATVLPSGAGTTTCAGNLAQTSFTWSLCSCNDVVFESNALVDGFNSLAGPYTPGQLGGGVGANSAITSESNADIWGQAWAASNGTAFNNTSTMKVHHDLQSGGDIQAGSLNCSRDAYVNGNISGPMSIAGTLYQSPGKSAGGTTFGSRVVRPVTVPPPCNCTTPIPVGAMVTYAQTHNDDASIGLNPVIPDDSSAQIDLPCGQYYLTGINTSNALTIVAHGNVALFIDGNVVAQDSLAMTIADATSQFDIFVSGTIVTQSELKMGNPRFPAQTRLYVGGTQTVDIQSDTLVGAEIWAGNAKVLWESDTDIFGSIFAGDFQATSDFKLHYDNAVAQVGSNCPPPGTGDGGTSRGGDGGGGGSCGSCTDCGNQACINGACASCTSSAQCCPPLVCQSGSCLPLTPVPR
jgi:hypothetical protein